MKITVRIWMTGRLAKRRSDAGSCAAAEKGITMQKM